jgi:hypothetical protein
MNAARVPPPGVGPVAKTCVHWESTCVDACCALGELMIHCTYGIPYSVTGAFWQELTCLVLITCGGTNACLQDWQCADWRIGHRRSQPGPRAVQHLGLHRTSGEPLRFTGVCWEWLPLTHFRTGLHSDRPRDLSDPASPSGISATVSILSHSCRHLDRSARQLHHTTLLPCAARARRQGSSDNGAQQR